MDAPECPICFAPIFRRLRFADCSHALCLSCGVRWLYRKSFCPFCRVPCSTLLVALAGGPPQPKGGLLIPQPPQDTPAEPAILKRVPGPSLPPDSKSAEPPWPPASKEKQAEPPGSAPKEREMSLAELLSTFWKEVSPEAEPEAGGGLEAETDPLQEIDISVFRRDLEAVDQLRAGVEEALGQFDSHIFYSDLVDVVADVKRSSEYYWDGLNERDPSISKFHFACFVEFVFKFLNELEAALRGRDFPLIEYLMSVVDEVYYNSYMEYYFRGYEGSEDDFDALAL